MREIKFRALSMCKGERWVYGDLRHYARNPHTEKWTIHDPATGLETDIDETTIGQFVGLKDKNGKEIYEGDIVDVVSLDTSSFGETKIAVIVYDEEMCCFDFKGADRQRCMCVSIPDVEIMIIGNIWDNPELIPYKVDE